MNFEHKFLGDSCELEISIEKNPVMIKSGFLGKIKDIVVYGIKDTDPKLNWHKLKSNRCPKCNKDFVKGLEITEGGKIYHMIAGDMSDKMMHHPCGFMITESRYKEIVESQILKSL